MKKNKKDKTLVKFVFWLTVFFLVQILFLTFFSFNIGSYKQLHSEDLEKETIFVEETRYEVSHEFKRNHMVFRILSGNEIYEPSRFSTDIRAEYNMSELNDAVKPGDVVIVEYVKEDSYNKVVGLCKSGEQLISLELYNEAMQSERVMAIITLVVLEIVYFAILFIFIWLNLDDLKRYRRAKQKREKRAKIEKESGETES